MQIKNKIKNKIKSRRLSRHPDTRMAANIFPRTSEIFGSAPISKIAVILREPKRLKNPVAFTDGDQTTLEIIRNFTGSFDSFHSLRMT